MNTPILLLIFNRPTETKRVFEAIRQAKPKQLFVGTDAPRLGNEKDKLLCQQALDVVKNIDWDCELKIFTHEKNVGSFAGITSAITWFFEHVDMGIILEDDCLPNQSFFDFCVLMLEKYKNNTNMGIISGDNFVSKDIIEKIDPSATHYYFTHSIYTWGYATWKRVWNLYEPNAKSWPEVKKQKLLEKAFHNKNISSLFNDYFEMIHSGRYKLYDVALFFTCIKHHLLCIVPPRNLISNIGILGIRSTKKSHVNNISTEYIDVTKLNHPASIASDEQIEDLIHDFWGYNKFNRRRLMIKILDIFGLHSVVRKIYRIFVKKKE